MARLVSQTTPRTGEATAPRSATDSLSCRALGNPVPTLATPTPGRGDQPGSMGDALQPIPLGAGLRPVKVQCLRNATCAMLAGDPRGNQVRLPLPPPQRTRAATYMCYCTCASVVPPTTHLPSPPRCPPSHVPARPQIKCWGGEFGRPTAAGMGDGLAPLFLGDDVASGSLTVVDLVCRWRSCCVLATQNGTRVTVARCWGMILDSLDQGDWQQVCYDVSRSIGGVAGEAPSVVARAEWQRAQVYFPVARSSGAGPRRRREASRCGAGLSFRRPPHTAQPASLGLQCQHPRAQ
jgi:hypothetical protein